MANVAFDKHIEFCERYMQEVQSTVNTLVSRGQRGQFGEHLRTFYALKKEYAAWIPEDILKELMPFEAALNKIDALSELSEDLKGYDNERREGIIDRKYQIFRDIMNLEEKKDEEGSEIALDRIKEKIRSILGITELTKIRSMLIKEALSFLEKDT